jgi:hypothetical protein
MLFHISQNLMDIPLAEYTQVDPFEGWKNNLETLDVNSSSTVSLKKYPKSRRVQPSFNHKRRG